MITPEAVPVDATAKKQELKQLKGRNARMCNNSMVIANHMMQFWGLSFVATFADEVAGIEEAIG